MNRPFIISTLMLALSLSLAAAPNPQRQGNSGPTRDEFGEVIAEWDLPSAQNAGLCWDEEQGLIWGLTNANQRRLYKYDPVEMEVVQGFNINIGEAGDITFDPEDGLIWVCESTNRNNSIVHKYNRQGQQVSTINLPERGSFGLAYDAINDLFIGHVQSEDQDRTMLYQISRDGQVIDSGPDIQRALNHNQSLALEYVPTHDNGPLWVMSTGFISRVNVNWDNDEIDVIEEFESANEDNARTGICHDGFDLWAGGNYNSTDAYIYDDGFDESFGTISLDAAELAFGTVRSNINYQLSVTISNVAEADEEQDRQLEWALDITGDDPAWLDVNSRFGNIAPQESFELNFEALTTDLDPGRYEKLVLISSNDRDNRLLQLPATALVVEGFARLSGTVTDSETEQPVAGATIQPSIPDWDFYPDPALSDDDGHYEFLELPAGAYLLSCSHDEYLRQQTDPELEPDQEREINFALSFATAQIDPENISVELERGQSAERELTLTNRGNGDLDWTASFRFPVENVQPWARRGSRQLQDVLDATYVEGVLFAEDRFFVSGSRNAQAALIYILNRDGEQIGSFDQPANSPRGIYNMTWDGEYIWGAGASDRRVYRFNTDGGEVASFFWPLPRPVNCIAWDSDREVLWMCDRTSSIQSTDRDGNRRGELTPDGFSIRGLAYWADDPDNHPLYMFHDEDDSMLVSKMNPNNEDVILVRNLSRDVEGVARGAFITGDFDQYSQMFMGVVGVGAAFRIDLWQLLFNSAWIDVDPAAGSTGPDGNDGLTLTLDAADLRPAAYEATLLIEHAGRGGALEVDALLTVTAPEEQFPPTAPQLLEPANFSGFELNEAFPDSNMDFRWTASTDPNQEDEVTYSLWFALSEGGDSVSYDAADTSRSLSMLQTLQKLLGDNFGSSDVPYIINWWVTANSGADSVPSGSRYELSVLYLLAAPPEDLSPVGFGIEGLYPNPFNSSLNISFGLDVAGRARLRVFDAAGRNMADIQDQSRQPGRYNVSWEAGELPGGLYFVRLESLGRSEMRKVVLMK